MTIIRRYVALLPLLVLVLLWLYVFWLGGALTQPPRGNNFGADYATFLGASKVLQDGGNPYDRQLLYRTEKRLLDKQHVHIQRPSPVIRAGNPPLFFWALEPLTGLSFVTTARVWLASMYLLAIVGFVCGVFYFGRRGMLWSALLFAAMPQVILSPGNVTGFIMAVVGFSLLISRRRPALAGAVLSLGWVRPQIALPLVLLVLLFHTSDRKSTAAGFALATVGLTALDVIVLGASSLSDWIAGVLSFSGTLAKQKELPGLVGLYGHVTSGFVQAGLLAASLAVALLCTGIVFWKRARSSQPLFLSVAWLWVLWLLATPYAHFVDEMLLAFPVLALVCQGTAESRRAAIAGLYLLFASVILVAWTPGHVELIPVPLLIVLAIFVRAARQLPQVALTVLAS